MKSQAQQIAQLHQQQQRQQQQQHIQNIGQQVRQQQQGTQQQHQLNIKQEVVDNSTGQTTQQAIVQNNSSNISQNIASGGNASLTQQHSHKGGIALSSGSSGTGHFVDSTTTSSLTQHHGFQALNNNGITRSGSCNNMGGPGTSSNLSTRDLFSLQEELLNGTTNISLRIILSFCLTYKCLVKGYC